MEEIYHNLKYNNETLLTLEEYAFLLQNNYLDIGNFNTLEDITNRLQTYPDHTERQKAAVLAINNAIARNIKQGDRTETLNQIDRLVNDMFGSKGIAEFKNCKDDKERLLMTLELLKTVLQEK